MAIEPQLSSNARSIMDKRWSRKGENGEPTETPLEIMQRVAMNVAAPNSLYERDQGPYVPLTGAAITEFPWRSARRAFDWMVKCSDGDGHHLRGNTFDEIVRSNWKVAEKKGERYLNELLVPRNFFPNSPTWTGAGTPLAQLAACFVLPISDDLGRARDSIFETMKVAILIQQTGGGNGFGFGRLRPWKEIVKRSMGQASGPVGFLVAYDAAFGVIAQGGARKGANMGVLPVWHPDAWTHDDSVDPITGRLAHPGWIDCKGKAGAEGIIENFNISLAIDDLFMDAVEKNADYDLHWGGKVYHTMPARKMFWSIAENAWHRGDPGNLFIDRANRDNPCPTHYTYEATNPCGEQWLPPYGSCNLGSINIGNFASWPEQPGGMGTFDWERFRKTICLATEFLDDVIDANGYVEEIPELEEVAMNERRIGLSGMGIADAMAIMGIRYGSLQGCSFVSQVSEYMRYWSMHTSIYRAKERGSFPWITDSIYDPALLKEYGEGGLANVRTLTGDHLKLWKRPEPVASHEYDFGRDDIDWDNIYYGLCEHGIRNADQTTWVPTGTCSNVADCEGSGIECMFALVYVRQLFQAGDGVKLDYASGLFHEALVRAGVEDDTIAEIVQQVKESGSCQHLDLVPDSVKRAFVVAADLTVEEHIWTQAAAQAFTSNAISKTINMPNSATVQDVADAYKLAYELGCKGITVYRQGSRSVEVLKVGTTDQVEVVTAHDWPVILPLEIPLSAKTEGLPARVIPFSTAFGNVQVTITEHPDHPGRPFDVRLGVGKAGNDKLADVEALGRMISGNTRAGVAVEWIVEQLQDIGGRTITGFGDQKVLSVADGVAKLLKRLYLDTPEAQAMTQTLTEVKALRELVDPNMVCPNCHNATVVVEAGCRHCSVPLGGCGVFNGCD